MLLQKLAIHGVPRSGTSWLGEVINSNEHVIYKYQPLFSYAFKSFLDENSSREKIETFFADIAVTQDDFLDQVEQRKRGTLPTFYKSAPTHIVYKEVRYHNILANLLQQDETVKLIALVRNPLAVMASWLSAPREFRRDLGWSIEQEWRQAPSKNAGRPEEFYGYEKWKEATEIFHILAWQYPQRVLLVEYKDLLAGGEDRVKNICQFIGLAFTEQMQQFIQASRSNSSADSYSVYRDKQQDNQWQATVDKSIVAAIRADLAGSPLEKYL